MIAKQAAKRCRRREDRLASAWERDDLIPDQAATFVRETARRTLGRNEW